MNSRAALLFALLFASASAASAEPKIFTKVFQIKDRANVQVDADDARVRVEGTNGSQVEVRVEYEGYTLGKTLRVEAEQHGDQVHVTVRTISHFRISLGNMNSRLRVEIHMPQQGDLQIGTSDGSVRLLTLHGKVKVRTSDGSVKASDIFGDVDLRTADGSITVDSMKGDLRLRSSDGSITGADLDGKCDAGTSDGSIKLRGRFDLLNIKSGDGSIDATAGPTSRMSGNWTIQSGDGSIELSLPNGFQADLDATTSDGRISLEIPIQVEGDMKDSKVRGKLNGGGPTLSIHSGDGSIHLEKS